MPYRLIFLCFNLFWGFIALAQPINDECQNAILLPIDDNWCSSFGNFTNIGATASSFGAPSCFGSTGNDVWFSFVAIGTDLNLSIIGNQSPASGGSLLRPQVALYTGNCAGTIFELQCATAPSLYNIVDMYKGGLVIGQTYLIRIQGISNNVGTFQICAQNYFAPALPGSDCITAAVLCDKAPFAVQSVTGGGLDPDEAFNSCIGGLGGNSESNSTWFKWTCDQSGSFVFSLTPNNISDDLDFVVYELPNGINNCIGKVVLRCMAAGNPVSVFPSACHGPTGLNFSATDFTEQAGCALGQDNWLAALNLVSGRSYALIVNNFTSTSNGFLLEFGGTATFRGPNAEIDIIPPNNNCTGEIWEFIDSSSSTFGNLVSWNWTFGPGASPSTSNSQGPHNVIYNYSGLKTISLSVETNEGCIITTTRSINVDSCCQSSNAIQQTSVVNDVLCSNSTNGMITIIPDPSVLTPYTYNWSTGSTNNPLSGLSVGDYVVTITSGICQMVDTLSINGPPAWQLQDSIKLPTCGGGIDGAVNILSLSGSNGSPYLYNWNNTVFNSTTSISNLSPGTYSLMLQDAQGCDTTISYQIYELALELDTLLSILNHLSCFGLDDGSIEVVLANGLAPYNFRWSHGATTALINNLSSGTYTLDSIWDSNLCRNSAPFSFVLTTPDSISLAFDSISIACSGLSEGQLISLVQGGVYPYQYLWSNAQQDSIAINLAAGQYTLTVTDSINCTKTQTISLSSPFIPTVSPYFNSTPGEISTNTITGTAIEIDGGNAAETNVTYIWSSSSVGGVAFDNDVAYTTMVTAIASGVHHLHIIATASNGCKDSASIVLTGESAYVGIPNAFSPNNDGTNDVFKPIGLPWNEILTFKIYNRWSQEIYDGSNSTTPGWDGSYNGVPQPKEVYLYLIIYQLYGTTEPITLRGEVTLLR